jgi:AbrB family looped-hinge helix DNA binding protein
MRMTSKGQVTIPIELRKKAGLRSNSEVEFDFDGHDIRIRPARRKGKKLRRGEDWIAHLRGSAGKPGITTDEIMALTRGED